MLLGRGLAPLARILSQAPAKLSVGTWREMLREFALSASSASHSRESAGLPGESKTVAILSPFSTAKGGLRNRHPRREPHSALWGEREGPVAERREGEVGSTANRLVRPPHPALSPRPAGG